MDNFDKRKKLAKTINWDDFSRSLNSAVDDDLEDDPISSLPEVKLPTNAVDDWADHILNPKEDLEDPQEGSSIDPLATVIHEIRVPKHLTAEEENALMEDIETLLLLTDNRLIGNMADKSKSKKVIQIVTPSGLNPNFYLPREKLREIVKPKVLPKSPAKLDIEGPRSTEEVITPVVTQEPPPNREGPLFQVISDLEQGLTVRKISGGTVKLTIKSLGLDIGSLDLNKTYPDKKAAYKAILKKSAKRQMISSTCVCPY
ncbi:phosphoprotein [Kamese virus]|uniref:Phosphoprotein n=1 Tax=Kamese virus TaxID=200402 RepID=A0A0D3R0Y7_9RHAB|nr:phosphoprotein [Kamese virus]AJR28329.1 phosphoprotein [Kamese virus]